MPQKMLSEEELWRDSLPLQSGTDEGLSVPPLSLLLELGEWRDFLARTLQRDLPLGSGITMPPPKKGNSAVEDGFIFPSDS